MKTKMKTILFAVVVGAASASSSLITSVQNNEVQKQGRSKAILLKKEGCWKIGTPGAGEIKFEEYQNSAVREWIYNRPWNYIGTIDSIWYVNSRDVFFDKSRPFYEVKGEKDISNSQNIPTKPSLKVIGAMEFSEIDKEKGPLSELSI